MSFGEILVVFLMFATLAVLVAGVVLMAMGGKKNEKHGNTLMVARVALQGMVFAVLALLFFISGK